MTVVAVNGDYVSLAQSVFLPADSSVNPFNDRFIHRVVNMDRDQLLSIPQIDDDQFLFQLIHNDDSMGGKRIVASVVLCF